MSLKQRRIAFTFDERSLVAMEQLKEQGYVIGRVTSNNGTTLTIPRASDWTHTSFDGNPLDALTMAKPVEGRAFFRIAGGMTCDCCGSREHLGGCVRGVLPCQCSDHRQAPSERFSHDIFGLRGIRCRLCGRCPDHCRCLESHREEPS